jgi:tungstate transport system ATP-binding protein
MNPNLALVDVSKRYGDVTAVKNVTMSVKEGEVFGIIGPSGAGKSTVLRLIDLLEKTDSGEVIVRGKQVSASSGNAHLVRAQMGMVLQKPVVLNRSVANNLAYSLRIRGWKEEDIAKKVDQELKKLGIEDRRTKNARTLSGGEMQRVTFSRATLFGPSILLLDEFAANLDPSNVALVEGMVRDYVAESPDRSVVLVTHNIFQAKRMCDTVALMWGGQMVEVAEKRKLFEDPADERTAAFIRGEVVY